MAEYIKREAAIAREYLGYTRYTETEWQKGYWDGVDDLCAHVKALPAADVAPVVHGKWVFDHTYTGKHKEVYVCSVCNHYQSIRKNHEHSKDPMYMNYCPFCGARMDGE